MNRQPTQNTQVYLAIRPKWDRLGYFACLWFTGGIAFFLLSRVNPAGRMQADISILKWFCVAAFLATVASIAVRIQDKYSLLELGNNGFYMRVGRRLLFFGTDHEVFVPWASLADLTFHRGRFQFLVFHLQTDNPEKFGFKSFETKDSGYVIDRCAGERSRAFVVVDRFEICPESVLSIIRQEIDRPVGNISEVDAREQLMLQEGERIIGDQWKR